MITLTNEELLIISSALFSCKKKIDTESCQPGTSVTYYSYNENKVSRAIDILENKVNG